MNTLVVDSQLSIFNNRNYARFCGKFTIYSALSLRHDTYSTFSEAVNSGAQSNGKPRRHVSLRTQAESCPGLAIGSTHEIFGDIIGSNAYLMPILKWKVGDERVTRIDTRLADRPPVRISGLGTLVTWQRFEPNAEEKPDLIQAVVVHKVKGATSVLVYIRLLLGWNYCHVDKSINPFEGCRIAYVGSFQGCDNNDGCPIVEVSKATLNFSGEMLEHDKEDSGGELSGDFD
ncbi:hypothetical protein Pst134EA_020852 [Puccinia striiformis f. sp. tritici]|uniref:Uncharacterized protein n=1 Tax=Puccinia striiformis TaxID=27350 RepID=A0A2S4UZP6_9BASI|nr:hypothetical protein Pst134EA_020852 [Puccinia striiformis f. sp. tritici]KAH9456946.1 hypothetical protein Pst134EA_020852 [Puccinia striiformis f. sp. tritici]KAI9620209.1 hypothetical protein H4Q26_013777 [Puccinia striiformis f. sp. tritici PST-130]POW02748.1 hypothetical protein PSHT_11979 [Puccinia striiformis]